MAMSAYELKRFEELVRENEQLRRQIELAEKLIAEYKQLLGRE